jgi:hypothetical protein
MSFSSFLGCSLQFYFIYEIKLQGTELNYLKNDVNRRNCSKAIDVFFSHRKFERKEFLDEVWSINR